MLISHGEGRFLAEEDVIEDLIKHGQILSQYVDENDRALGKMGHAERKGKGLYRNVPGEFDMKMFESAVQYFRG